MTRTEQFNQTLNHVSNLDTESVSAFLKNDFHRPLLVTGSGGSFAACRFASLLYNAAGGFARAETPYTLNSISDKTLAQSKLLVVSSSGKNADAQYILSRGKRIIPRHTMTTSGFPHPADVPKQGFVSTGITSISLVYKSFISQLLPADSDTERMFSYRFSGQTITPPSLANFNHFVVLHGSWGKPAAVDF